MNLPFFRSVFILSAIVLCSVAHSGRPPDWLALPTSESARPAGASSWVLLDSSSITQTSATSSVRRYRRAFMPLSQAGVNSLACAEQFTAGTEELVSARAWAMSPDGKKCRAFGGDEFAIVSLTVSNLAWDQRKIVYFNPLRYLQTGWIFAYEIEISSKYTSFDARWTPDHRVPVRQTSFELVPLAGGEIRWRAYAPELEHPAVGANGAVKWTLTNLGPINPQTPEHFQLKQRDVRGYFATRSQVAAKQTQSWSEVVQLVRKEMVSAISSSPDIDAEAKRLAGSGSLWQRAAPLCRFVQKEVAYMQVTIDTDTMAGYRPHVSSEVFTNRYGDCKDKAVLLSTMLKQVGIETAVVLVNSGEPRQNTADWPSAWFNHAIVAIRADEAPPEGWPVVESVGKKWVLFDPTAETTPLGFLPLDDSMGLGLLLHPDVDRPFTIPANAPSRNKTSLVVNVQVNADGSVVVESAEERCGIAGAAAIASEQASSPQERTGAFEKRVQASVPLVTKLDWNSVSEVEAHRWTATAQFSAQFVGKRLTKGQMFVSPDLLLAVPQCRAWEDGVDGWLLWPPSHSVREVRFKLPDGWEVNELPPKVELTNSAGVFTLDYKKDGQSVIGQSRVELTGGVLDRAAYLELRTMIHRLAAASRAPLVLQRVVQSSPAPATAPSS